MKHKISKVFFVVVMLLVVSLFAVACNDGQDTPDPDKYAVTYVGGAQTTGTAPSGGEYIKGEQITLPGAGTLEKTGFTFGGWSYGGQTYAAGSKFTMPEQAVEFTAVWISNGPATYTITYDIDGATGTAPIESAKEAGAKFNIASATGLQKTGHTFAGWSFGGQDYAEGAEFTMPGNAVVFKAVWKVITYTVTFNPNNADEPKVWTEKVEYGKKVAKPAQDPTIDSGKMFRYWINEANELVYNFDTVVTKDITLNASYAYKVTFSAGEGTGEIEPMWVTTWRPYAITLPDGTGLSNGNKVFNGWTDGTNNYAAGDGYGAFGMKNPTFTALWKDAEEPVDGFTLSFGSDESNSSGTAPAVQVKQAGDKIILPENTWFYTTIQGYVFKGWYIEGNYSGGVYQPGYEYTMPAKNVKFMAKWGMPTYTVTYKAGEHATGKDVIQEKDQNSNINLKSLADLNNPFTVDTTQNYTFAGWKIEGDTSNKIYYAGDEYQLKSNVVFVAQWQIATQIVFYDDTYTATLLMSLSGNIGSGRIEIYVDDNDYDIVGFTYKLEGEQITVTLNNSDVFTGTFKNDQLDISIIYEGTTYKFTPTEEPGKPLVTFDANGGTGTEPAEVTIVESGAYYKVTMPANTFTAPANSKFKAWLVIINDKESGEKKAGTSVMASAGERILLKAVWETTTVEPEVPFEGIVFVGNCTTPTKTMFGTTLGGETFVKFEIDFANLKVKYTLSDSTTAIVTASTVLSNMPDVYGSDVTYLEVKMAGVTYYLLVNADKTKLMMCNSDDQPLDNGEFALSTGSTEPGGYVSVALADLNGKTFTTQDGTAFYSTYTTAAISWNNNASKYVIKFTPAGFAGHSYNIEASNGNQNYSSQNFIAERSGSTSYDVEFGFEMGDDGKYVMVITKLYKTSATDENLIAETVRLYEA